MRGLEARAGMVPTTTAGTEQRRDRVVSRLAAPAIAIALALSTVSIASGKEDDWVRVDTPNFVLFGDVSGRRLIEIGRHVEVFRKVIPQAIYGLSLKSEVPTLIYVFHSTESFGRYHLGSDGKPRGIAGIFLPGPDANYVTMDASGDVTPYDIVQRGYMYKVLLDTLPATPMWARDGLTDFLGSARPDAARRITELGRPPSVYLRRLRIEQLIPVDRLLVISEASFEYDNPDTMAVFHAESWALVHWFFMEDAKRRGRFLDFLSRLKAGEPSNTAFSAAIGMKPAEIQTQIEKYVQRTSYGLFQIPFDEGIAREEYTAIPISRAETYFRLGELLSRMPPIRYIDAEKYLRAALELEPGHAGAQAALASLQERRRKLNP